MKRVIKTVRRFDRLQVTGKFVKDDKSGYWRGPAAFTRAGVFEYYEPDAKGNIRRVMELREPKQVFNKDSINSLKGVPLTNDHPEERVDRTNARKFACGSIGDAIKREDDLLTGLVTIWDKNFQEDIEDGKRELSCGYDCEILEESGHWRGIYYDRKQINIRYNHVAGVDEGRAGPQVKLRLDAKGRMISYGVQSKVINKMKLTRHVKRIFRAFDKKYRNDAKSVKIGDTEYSLDSEENINAAVAAATDEIKKMAQGDAPAPAEEEPAEEGAEEEPADPEEEEEEPMDTKKDRSGNSIKKSVNKIITTQLQAKLDAATARLAKLESKDKKKEDAQKEKERKAKFDLAVKARVKLENIAKRLKVKTDGLSDEEIMCAVIVADAPKSDRKDVAKRLRGKTAEYIRARFDAVAEDIKPQKEAEETLGDLKSDSWIDEDDNEEDEENEDEDDITNSDPDEEDEDEDEDSDRADAKVINMSALKKDSNKARDAMTNRFVNMHKRPAKKF
jgi:uncharacterized protein